MVCDHVGDNMFLCHIGEVMVVIEKVVDEYDDRVYKMAKVVTKEWMKFKTAKPGYFFRFRCRDDSSFILKQYPASVVPLAMFLNAVPATPNKRYCALYNVALQRKTNVLTTFV